MRLAFVLRRLPLRSELSTSVVDAEALANLIGAGHDVSVFVDEQGAGVDVIREAGAFVDVSPKRAVHIGGWVTADHAVARHVAGLHADDPLDLIITSPDVGGDPTWAAPELAGVPLGLVLGDDMHRVTRLVTDDPALRAEAVYGQWVGAGALFDADFLVGAATPADFGLAAGCTAPPTVSFGPPPEVSGRPPDDTPGMTVVVATTRGRDSLATVVGETWDVVPWGPGMVTVVVVPDIDLTHETVGDLVLAGVPPDRREGVIVVPAGPDGVAWSFLQAADVVVAAGRAEAGIPALVDRSRRDPLIGLGGTPATSGSFESALELSHRPASRVVVTGSAAEMAAGLERADADVVILHEDRGSAQAARLFGAPRLSRRGVTVLTKPGPIHGSAEPASPDPFVLAVGREARAAVVYLLEECETLWDLIRAVLSPINANHLHVRALPTSIGAGTRPLTGLMLPRRAFGRGPLELASTVTLPAPPPPAPTPAASQGTDIRRWVRGRPWTDRIRLALPWKFGLLPKAMKDKW